MTKKAIIKINIQWLMNHRAEKNLPGVSIAEVLENNDEYMVAKSSLGTVTIFFNDKSVNEDKITADVNAAFESVFADVSQPYDINTEPLEDEDAKLFLSLLSGKYSNKKYLFDDAEDFNEDSVFAKAVNEIENELNTLVGGKEFKNLIEEILRITPEIKRKETYDVFKNRCYLFSIGEGFGLTKYLNILANTLAKTGLCKMSSDAVKEVSLDSPAQKSSFDDAESALDSGSETSVKVLCIDVSEWIGSTETGNFKKFLRLAEKHRDEFIMVFRVPFLEKYTLAEIEESLSDVVSIKTVSVPPLTTAELKTYAKNSLENRGYKVVNSAWKYFDQRIAEERSDGRFYGLNTVNKVVKEIIFNKQLDNTEKRVTNDTISPYNMKSICRKPVSTNLSGEKELDALVGNEQIKQKVKEIIAQIENATKNGSKDRPCIHMKFVGNPGTGKTTVARIIGKILKEKGILRCGNFYEHMARDLCGKFIGETSPKTASICRDALGSVLFIDEAYSLYRGGRDSKDYGLEALDTLIAEMENHRDDLVVILAGYTDEMEVLMQGNSGLRSRIPYSIEFPNFTKDELYRIFIDMVGKKHKYDETLAEAAKRYFDSIPDSVLNQKSFSNARFVRNLYERTWAKASMRCQLEGTNKTVFTKDDFERASQEKEFDFGATNRRPKIGF